MGNQESKYASDAQLVLARLYQGVSIIGLTLIAATFAMYVSGLLETSVPAEEVTAYWHLDAVSYAEETGTPVGWDFIEAFFRGDSLSFFSLIFMGSAVVICLAIMAVTFLRKRKLAYALIALLQTIVLVTAASGIVSGH